MEISILPMDDNDLRTVRGKVKSNFVDYAKSIGLIIYGTLFGIGYKGKAGLHDSMSETYGFWGAILMMSFLLVPVTVLFYFLAYFKTTLDYLKKKKMRIRYVVLSKGGPLADNSCYFGLHDGHNRIRSYIVTPEVLETYAEGDTITYELSRHDKILLNIISS